MLVVDMNETNTGGHASTIPKAKMIAHTPMTPITTAIFSELFIIFIQNTQ